jgi:hypothetical protein
MQLGRLVLVLLGLPLRCHCATLQAAVSVGQLISTSSDGFVSFNFDWCVPLVVVDVGSNLTFIILTPHRHRDSEETPLWINSKGSTTLFLSLNPPPHTSECAKDRSDQPRPH